MEESSLFWDAMQRRLVVSYRRFGTTYQFQLQKSCTPIRGNYPTAMRNIHKSKDLIDIAAGACNQTKKGQLAVRAHTHTQTM